MKPAIFVASSSNSKGLAYSIQANLDLDADVTCWDQGVFLPGQMTLDVLLAKAADFDFGTFIFSPDDIVKMNSAELTTARDNVSFDFGLFASKLGRERVFIIMPNTSVTEFHLPSDLAGLTTATYDERRSREGDNPQAFLGPACQKIRNVIVDTWGESAILTPDLVLLLRYLDRDSNQWLTPDRYARDIAVSNGAPEEVDAALAKGWQRAIRYGLMCLYLEGFVRRRVDTSLTYSISQKGRRILFSRKVQVQFHETFNKELRSPSEQPWGDGQAPMAAGKIAGLEAQVLALHENNAMMEQGLKLAAAQAAMSAKAQSELEKQIQDLKAGIAAKADITSLSALAAKVDTGFGKLAHANSAVSSTLSVSTGSLSNEVIRATEALRYTPHDF